MRNKKLELRKKERRERREEKIEKQKSRKMREKVQNKSRVRGSSGKEANIIGI